VTNLTTAPWRRFVKLRGCGVQPPEISLPPTVLFLAGEYGRTGLDYSELGIYLLCFSKIFSPFSNLLKYKQETSAFPRFFAHFKVCCSSASNYIRFNSTTFKMLAKFQILFSLLTLFLSGGKSSVSRYRRRTLANTSPAFAVSNTTFITSPSGIVTAPPTISTGSSGNGTVNSTLLVTPTLTAGSTSTPSSVHVNAAGSNVGYLNVVVVGVVAMGAAFVSL
jgi:hypothetical protein